MEQSSRQRGGAEGRSPSRGPKGARRRSAASTPAAGWQAGPGSLPSDGPLGSRLKIRFLPSPHQRDRGGREVELIVVHHISCPPGCFDPEDVEALFLGRLDTAKHPAYREVAGRELSAHFVVDRGGRVTQFVPTGRVAFHAGASRWRGREGCNDFSVGVELIGDAAHAFTARQYATLARLCRDLMRAHPGIRARGIVGHSRIAVPPGRKTDPGPRFDWARLRRELAGLPGNRPRPEAPVAGSRRCATPAAPEKTTGPD